jgi:hypothetical protein
MENLRRRWPRLFGAHITATKNVKQGYPLSQLAFRMMTRKTQDVRYCNAGSTDVGSPGDGQLPEAAGVNFNCVSNWTVIEMSFFYDAAHGETKRL